MIRKTITTVTLNQARDGWTASTFTDDTARTQFTTTKTDTEDEAVRMLIDMCARHGIVAEFSERVAWTGGQRRLL